MGNVDDRLIRAVEAAPNQWRRGLTTLWISTSLFAGFLVIICLLSMVVEVSGAAMFSLFVLAFLVGLALLASRLVVWPRRGARRAENKVLANKVGAVVALETASSLAAQFLAVAVWAMAFAFAPSILDSFSVGFGGYRENRLNLLLSVAPFIAAILAIYMLSFLLSRRKSLGVALAQEGGLSLVVGRLQLLRVVRHIQSGTHGRSCGSES